LTRPTDPSIDRPTVRPIDRPTRGWDFT
jgi:hypothetical protein